MFHSRRLQYIHEVVRAGSIRRAAERLNVAPSAINRQIIAIEEDIGAELFVRLPRGIRLTSVGELYVRHARETLKNYDSLREQVRSLRSPEFGTVSLITTPGLASGAVGTILREFMSAHPRIRLQLLIDSVSMPVPRLLAGEIDLMLGFHVMPKPGLKCLAAYDVPLGAVLAPAHPLAAKPALMLSDLIGQPLLLGATGSTLRDAVDLAFAPLEVTPAALIESNASNVLRSMAEGGLGIAIMNPLDVLQELAAGRLVFRSFTDRHIRPQPLKLFAQSRAALSPAASRLADVMARRLDELCKTLPAMASSSN